VAHRCIIEASIDKRIVQTIEATVQAIEATVQAIGKHGLWRLCGLNCVYAFVLACVYVHGTAAGHCLCEQFTHCKMQNTSVGVIIKLSCFPTRHHKYLTRSCCATSDQAGQDAIIFY
jgi:hypothetical protein